VQRGEGVRVGLEPERDPVGLPVTQPREASMRLIAVSVRRRASSIKVTTTASACPLSSSTSLSSCRAWTPALTRDAFGSRCTGRSLEEQLHDVRLGASHERVDPAGLVRRDAGPARLVVGHPASEGTVASYLEEPRG
jgi:hypothetical protein